MNLKWEFSNTDLELAQKIASKYNISNLLAKILVNKQIIVDEQINQFLNPTRNDFHDPYDMPDMGKAVERIIKAIETNEKVCIYGDYDADGITSTTVLKKYLLDRGLDCGYYIPNRIEEGYGLNLKAIETIYNQGYTLIITVDCGISSVKEVDYAKSLGMDVIVTDHHEPQGQIPECIAVIDCKRKDNKYECPHLAGVGVAFKLTQAISQKLNLDEKEHLKYLDIVCIGTISDIVPLVDENRVIAKLGLKLVGQTRNPGLKELINSCGYKEINSMAVSFGIAPRINACGRMGHEKDAIELFLTDDIIEAKKITEKLNNYNRERQDIEKSIFEEVLQIIKEKHLDKKNAIVVGKDNWHHGVIGIVSSKITDMYYKPSILVCFDGEEGNGSGRSIPGFNLHDALNQTNQYLSKYGGHSMACGLTLKTSDFNKFVKDFESLANEAHLENLQPILTINQEISNQDLTLATVESLKCLEPFGEANPVPYFLYKNLKVDSIRSLSEGKHLKLTLRDNSTVVNAIGFNLGNLADEFIIGDKIDCVCTLEINEFNGYKNIQLNLKDIRKSY